MESLAYIRERAGRRTTDGLPDEVIARFLAKDVKLALAIEAAHRRFAELESSMDFTVSESELIRSIIRNWCNFYPEDCRMPFVPLGGKGPWIVTTHGAVVYDSGGYGMLGLGHAPAVTSTMAHPFVMANIMTPSLEQKMAADALRWEIGHTRRASLNQVDDSTAVYSHFLFMNSGSEGNAVVDRIIDGHTGRKRLPASSKVLAVCLESSFHGRTLKPAVLSDSSSKSYAAGECRTLLALKREYVRVIPPNDTNALREVFKTAAASGHYIEAVYLEAVMGEGNPGYGLTPEFYDTARQLTLENDSVLVIDSVQAGIRCHGVLSIADYPGFQRSMAPDFEVFSKAVNAGQYPVSVVAMTKRAFSFYRSGIYGNTMTGNPRACAVVANVLGEFRRTPALRRNVVEMGKEAVAVFTKLKLKYPHAITNVTGTGLLFAVHMDKNRFPVVAVAGAEHWLRTKGIGVIHGGENALRFTPHLWYNHEELQLQADMVEEFIKNTADLSPQMRHVDRMSAADLMASFGTSQMKKRVRLTGHLFDKGAVGESIKVCEAFGVIPKVLQLRVGCPKDAPSVLVLELGSQNDVQLESAVSSVSSLAARLQCHCESVADDEIIHI